MRIKKLIKLLGNVISSVLMHWYTKTDTNDPTIYNSSTKTCKERQYNRCPLIVLVYQDSTISSLNIINISENVTMLISRAATGIAMFSRPSDLSDNFFAAA